MSYACSADSGPNTWSDHLQLNALECLSIQKREYEAEYKFYNWPRARPVQRYSDQERDAAFKRAVETLDAALSAKVERPHLLWEKADDAREAYRKAWWSFLPSTQE